MVDPRAAVLDASRLATLRQSGLLDSPAVPAFDRLTRLAATALEAGAAFVSLVDVDRQFFVSCFGADEPVASERQTPLSHSFCQYAVATREPLVIGDARVHPLVSTSPAITELGVIAYLGAPLIAKNGAVLGTLCVTDSRPRQWTARNLAVLRDLAACVMDEIELRLQRSDAQGRATAAERLARDESARYQALVEHVPAVVYTATAERLSQTLYISPRIETLLGYAPEEWLSTPDFWFERVHPDDRPTVLAENERTATLGQPFDLEYRLLDRDGRIVWIRDEATLIHDDNGAAVWWQGVWTDMTARRRSEQQLLLQHQIARILAESSTLAGAAPAILATICESLGWRLGGFWQPDSADEALTCVATWHAPEFEGDTFASASRRLVLRRGEGLPGRVWRDEQALWIPDLANDAGAARAALAAETGVHAALAFPVHDGQRVVGVFDLFDSHVQPPDESLLALARLLGLQIGQLVARERMESALRDSEERFRSTYSNVGQMTTEFDGRFRTVNRALCELTGYSEAELLATSLPALSHPEDRQVGVDPVRRLVSGEVEAIRVEKRYLRKDGSVLHALVSASAIRDATGAPQYLISLVHDITELRSTHAALRASEARNRAIVETTIEAIITIDRDGHIEEFNPAAEDVFGYQRDSVLGRELAELIIPPVYRDQHRRGLEHYRATGEGPILNRRLEVTALRADGEEFPIELSITRVPGIDPPIFTGFMRDISERKAQERLLSEAMAEAERANRAKSEFLSRMSHELRTPLNAILGFAEILEMDLVADDHREMVGHILKGGNHLLDLINDILDISRIEAGHLRLSIEPVPLDGLIAEAIALIQPLAARRGIAIELSEPLPAGLHVQADRQRLKQVLLNLLSNAVKYNRDDGQVRLSLTEAPDSRLRVAVHDTGPGISEAGQRRLFEPFERLDLSDAVVEGTGLGLALSKALVAAMQGTIGVTSAVGAGSTFWIELPLAVTPEAVAPAGAAPVTSALDVDTATRSVLCIDDNLPNLKLIERLIAYRPGTALVSAMQGRMGITLAQEHQPNLILLDIQLPDIQGDEVLARLKSDPQTRDIPVVVVSADATPRQVERLLDSGAAAYVTKPLNVKRFLNVLDEYLSSPPP